MKDLKKIQVDNMNDTDLAFLNELASDIRTYKKFLLDLDYDFENELMNNKESSIYEFSIILRLTENSSLPLSHCNDIWNNYLLYLYKNSENIPRCSKDLVLKMFKRRRNVYDHCSEVQIKENLERDKRKK